MMGGSFLNLNSSKKILYHNFNIPSYLNVKEFYHP